MDIKLCQYFKDWKVMSIVIKNKNGVSLTFRDSYLMLNDSLKKLSKTFNCDDKLIEPVLIDINLRNPI